MSKIKKMKQEISKLGERINNIVLNFNQFNDEIKDKIERQYNTLNRKYENLYDNSKKMPEKGYLANILYLMNTKFLGTLKNKKLISLFKKELRKSDTFEPEATSICSADEVDSMTFESLKKEISTLKIDEIRLSNYMQLLKSFEEKQKLIDYCTERNK